jgi:hypothetical protein
MNSRLTLSLLATTALLAGTPAFSQQSRDGTPGNPPSTATGRAVDRMQGETPQPDGTPGNPPGTAAGRALDQGTGSGTTDANRSGTTNTMAGATEAGREGLRASRIIGSNVYNEQNENVGEVEELLLGAQGGPSMAVISVGGFLGIGAKQVAVPFAELRHNTERDRWVLPGATRDSLKERPAFAYANDRARGSTATGTSPPTRGAVGGGSPATERPATPRQ